MEGAVKRDRLVLSQHQSIETGRDWSGRFFIAYSGGASVFIRDLKELRRFLKIPKSIPMRESLESWLASLADMDAKRKGPVEAPVGDANVEGSWDPHAHDVDNTGKMIT
jgi:hypothetical protein